MRIPTATYRLQVNATFTLEDATRLIPYLEALGVTDAYLSPVLAAQPGSTHGYDVVDPGAVREEIGGEPAFRALSARLRASGMGLLLDIVPNHMAASPNNPWWTDLLEFGGDSPYAQWFDLSWRSVDGFDKLHLPILGTEWPDPVEQGEMHLTFDVDGLALAYYEYRIPLAPGSYASALGIGARAEPLHDALEDLPQRWQATLDALANARRVGSFSEAPRPERRVRALDARAAFLQLCQGEADFRSWVERRVTEFEQLPAAERERRLSILLELQPYRLCSWRTSTREVTYRRFFDITHLVGVRVEEPHVFDATHARFREWIRDGDLTGLRIDHIDGLFDPEAYLQRLREIGPVYTVVEKILSPDESQREEWEAEGTTGYDFLNVLNGWFIEPRGLQSLREAYRSATASEESFRNVAYRRKKLVLTRIFGGEMAVLQRELRALLPDSDLESDECLERALLEVIACLDVYRTYVSPRGIAAEDRSRIERAVADARLRARHVPPETFDALRSILLLESTGQPLSRRTAALRFAMHWQQLTGPVMAKGVEDTALYNYLPLVSANDVGGDPGEPVVPTARLHAFLKRRWCLTPATMNATSTHDTKRGEDVRARLNVLTEFPDAWSELLGLCRPPTAQANEAAAEQPSATDDVLLLQTLLGTWPIDSTIDSTYAKRVREYMVKAARESKSATTWREQNPSYEQALVSRVGERLHPGKDNMLRPALEKLARQLAYPGALNALAQVVLKATAPGIPDFYQGSELWYFALVDPDNRRPVDFRLREDLLAQLLPIVDSPTATTVQSLRECWADGRIKLFVTAAALRHRRARQELFRTGAYHELEVSGENAERVAAFCRRRDGAWSVTIASRWVAAALPAPGGVPGPSFWQATAVQLPIDAPRRWRNILTGEIIETNESSALEVRAVFATLPSAILSPTN